MKRVLVTGASGFVGRPLTSALASSGYAVRAASRQRPIENVRTDVEIVLLPDLAERAEWAPLLAGVDIVVHLAGIAHAGGGIPESHYDRVNHSATGEIATAAGKAGVSRFVFVSSVRAQSGPAAEHTLRETDEPRPTDAYGRSKLAAEAAVMAAPVPSTILRPVLIFGPGVKGNLRAFARLARLPLPLPLGAFTNRRSLLSVEDLVGAVLFVLENPVAAGQTYLVADPQPISIAEIAASLRRGLGRRPGLVSVPPNLVRSALLGLGRRGLWHSLGGELVADPSKLILAGWAPKTPAAEGLAEMTRTLA